jgi:hypothetical protein
MVALNRTPRSFRCSIWGLRYYSPDQGRWTRRDPIGVYGGFNPYLFAANTPAGVYDFLGLWGRNEPPASASMGCCHTEEGDVIYNPASHCCCEGKVKSRTPRKTGIKKCCVYAWGIIPRHCWIQWSENPYDSAGFSVDWSLWLVRGEVTVPDNWPTIEIGVRRIEPNCTDFYVSECDCDPAELKKCVAAVANLHDWETWPPPRYNLGIFDCRHYPGYLVRNCCKRLGCAGQMPPNPRGEWTPF